MIRIGQVGVGYWGKNLLRNFAMAKGAQVVAVCETDESARDRVSRAHTGIAVTSDFDAFLDRSDIDAVVIATQTPDHFDMTRRALGAGKHVFVEKPMARTAHEAGILVELADAKGLTLMTGHLLLYHPAFEYVERLIADGRLGDVFYMYSTRVNLGIIRSDENALESLMPHDFAVALHLLGTRPVAISAQGQSFLQPGIEDVVFATVHFEDGKMAHFHASWLDPHKARKVTIVGSDMMAVIDDVEAVEKVRLYDKGVDIRPGEGRAYANYVESMTLRTGDITIPRIEMSEPLSRECAHFIEAIRTGRPPRSDGRNGLAVVSLMEAGMRSLRARGSLESISLPATG
jgi:predicted dehydrogenase